MSLSPGENLPEGFFGWVATAVGVALTTLAGAVASLWKISESKNAKAIQAQEQQITNLQAEVKGIRDNLYSCEQARHECESHRASLQMKCEFIEARLNKLENPKAQ